MEIKQDMDFNDLRNNCWGQATKILEEISNADKEDDLMYYLEEIYYDEIPTLTEVNDILAYDWEQVYDAIGLKNFEIDSDTINSALSSIADWTSASNRYLTVSDVYDYEENMSEADKSEVIDEVHQLMFNLADKLNVLQDSDEDDYEDNLSDAQDAANELDSYCEEHLETESCNKIYHDITESIEDME